MKANTGKSNIVKKTIARKKVVDAHVQLDSQAQANQEEFHRKVACKAYELFARRGYQHGNHLEDWHQAERIIEEGLE